MRKIGLITAGAADRERLYRLVGGPNTPQKAVWRVQIALLDGTVIGTCMPRHRHRELLRFLTPIDQQIPAGLDFHLIVENHATRKIRAVESQAGSHPQFHFTPTSWLNMVERLFAEITRNRIRCGACKSVGELKGAIVDCLPNPKPFIWSKPVG